MFEIISALWPVFALILLGYIARRAGFPGEDFWRQAEKATYYILFPILLVSRLATTDMSVVDLPSMGASVCLLVLAGSVVSFLLKPFTAFDAAEFTSFYQGSVRFNVYVGLAASATLYSGLGVAVGAVLMALMIPLLNVCCVLVFSVLTNRNGGLSSVYLAVIKNPLIISSLLGLVLNQTGLGFPAAIEPVADLLSRMALPLGLLSVGAGLSFRVLYRSGSAICLSSVIKLILMPLMAFFICMGFSLEPESAQVVWLYAALPTATSSYILARQLGGDAPMMAAIVTGQTLISMISIPFMLIFLYFLQKSL